MYTTLLNKISVLEHRKAVVQRLLTKQTPNAKYSPAGKKIKEGKLHFQYQEK